MKYTQKELENMLAEFRASPAEPSWLEFKTGLKDPVQIAKYISATLTDDQKKTKMGNLLSLKMKRRMGWIDNFGNDKKSLWILTDIGIAECKSKNPSCKRKCKRTCKKELGR